MSANMRATPRPSSSGRHGSEANVAGSGIASMSDSSIALKPVIEEPSKPMPPSKASSSWSALIENDFSWPRTSVNQSRMKRILRSSTIALTSSGVRGWSGGGVMGRQPKGSVEPAVGPALQLLERRRELPAHARELVLDPHGRAFGDAPLDDSARLELLHALGQQAVGEVGHRLGDL